LTELEQEDVEAPRLIQQVVSLKNISKEYSASGKKIKALDDISFDVKPNELIVLLGPSGAGKTTILNLIAGLEKPTSGEVRVMDIDLVDSDENFLSSFRAANIGFIFQSYNLVSTLTARENVELMMELAGWSDANRNEKRTAELIESVGLTERADHLPAQLSGGEQQRVAIARALANDPQLIIADEPTGNLDMKTGSEIVALLESLNRDRGKTVIITTHDERIVKMADVVFRMDKGRLAGIDEKS
jgi:putative ABC transport system ATP-binding protein